MLTSVAAPSSHALNIPRGETGGDCTRSPTDPKAMASMRVRPGQADEASHESPQFAPHGQPGDRRCALVNSAAI